MALECPTAHRRRYYCRSHRPVAVCLSPRPIRRLQCKYFITNIQNDVCVLCTRIPFNTLTAHPINIYEHLRQSNTVYPPALSHKAANALVLATSRGCAVQTHNVYTAGDTVCMFVACTYPSAACARARRWLIALTASRTRPATVRSSIRVTLVTAAQVVFTA
jgi:hypothetical protein